MVNIQLSIDGDLFLNFFLNIIDGYESSREDVRMTLSIGGEILNR